MEITTLRTTANDCPNKFDCPSVHDVDIDPDRRYVVSTRVTPAERAAFLHLLGPGEVVGWVPAGFLPATNSVLDRTRGVRGSALRAHRQYVITDEVTDPAITAAFGDLVSRNEVLGDHARPCHDGGVTMVDYLDSLGGFILDRYKSPGDRLIRMEQLPQYRADSDGGDFQRWLDGAAEPVSDGHTETVQMLRDERGNGQIRRRIRVLSADLTDYERYSCEFGYAHNVEAGEDIRILHRGEHEVPPLLGVDYWLVNDRDLARMHYDDEGRFLGAQSRTEMVDDAVRETAACWEVAEPFATWWARHHELHRQPIA